MDEHSANEPLLLSQGFDTVHVKKKPIFVSLVKWILKIVMWVIFIAWVIFIFLYPLNSVNDIVKKWSDYTSETFLGIAGAAFLVFTGPILVIAFLSIPYLIISGEEELQERKSCKHPRCRLWTFPVLVNGPLGVVSAAELIGIFFFVLFLIWAVYVYTMRNLSQMEQTELSPQEKGVFMLKVSAISIGLIGLFCLAFLFLPIARGSILLRLIDIPFEHATRYHVWLGHLTMSLFSLHGLFYVIAWSLEGQLLQNLTSWEGTGVANLAGVIGLLAGLLMWVTSLPPVRKQYFELFFYTHQLYIVFVIFLALHVGSIMFSMAAGGIFLFMLDRFLRFCQSRTTVDIVSATSFPCGVVKLDLSTPKNIQYNALSFIFVQIRELSWLQWHPFSVSSSPLDSKYHISILIKVMGGWTTKLNQIISNVSGSESLEELPLQHLPKITTSIEGPYGHEISYHHTYEKIVLVAGGIGISPFLAVLSDILHRIRQGKPCLVKNILLVWAVKKSNELVLLSTVNVESICPNFSEKLSLEILIYVTRESEPPLEEGTIHNAVNSFIYPVSNGRSISNLVGTGCKIWSGIYMISSIVGFAILMGLINTFYINPFGIDLSWYKGFLLLALMVASVIIFGGLVVGLWHLCDGRISAQEEGEDRKKNLDLVQQDEIVAPMDLCQDNVASTTSINYGSRPDFKEIFKFMSERWGYVDMGVIVCGPPTLELSVAKECRSLNIRRQGHHPVFHFNTHSFEL